MTKFFTIEINNEQAIEDVKRNKGGLIISGNSRQPPESSNNEDTVSIFTLNLEEGNIKIVAKNKQHFINNATLTVYEEDQFPGQDKPE